MSLNYSKIKKKNQKNVMHVLFSLTYFFFSLFENEENEFQDITIYKMMMSTQTQSVWELSLSL